MIRLLVDAPALLAWCVVALASVSLAVLLAYGLVRRLLDPASAHARYFVAVGTLVLLVVSVPLTIMLASSALVPRLSGEIPPDAMPPALTHASTSLTAILPWLGLLWATGFLLAITRLFLGAVRLSRVCRAARATPDAAQPGAALLQRAGLRHAPRVLESDEIAGPFVTGWGNGILVLPAGLLERLPADERDAVLLHELMHLKRGDFAGNLLQRLVTAMLWFEPAVWLVGSEIDRVREECCDDAVIRVGGEPRVLARALVRLEEMRSGSVSLGMAGTGGALLQRVRRLVGELPATPETSSRHWPALAAIGAVGLAGTSVGGHWAASLASRSVPIVTISAEDPAGRFSLEMAGGILRGMSVAGSAVPKNRLSQTGATIHLLNAEGRPELDIMVSRPTGIRWTPRPPTSP